MNVIFELEKTITTLLKIKDLSISFKTNDETVKAVKSVSFDIARGETLGIVGESGSGKSVTALAIMRLLSPQAIVNSGRIDFDGNNILELSAKEIRRIRTHKISMIFQEPMTSLNPVMRCGKQVAEVFENSGLSKSEIKNRVIDLFDKVKLPRPEKIYTSYPHEISGGQKQRVMIAMAIANKPDLLIADEPTTALDVRVQKDLILLLKQLKKEFGMSLLFISHDLGLVSEIVSNVLVMYKGEVVERGAIKDVFMNPQHNYTKGLLACRPPLNERPLRLKTIDEFIENNGVVQTELPKKQHIEIDYNKPILNIENLNKSFVSEKNYRGKATSYVKAVDDVSFEVFKGETLGLVGESGCGKTTLSRSILRLIDVESGKIYFDEKNILDIKKGRLKEFRKNMNIVFQDPYSSLNPRISVGKAISEPLKVFNLETNSLNRKNRVFDLLKKVGLDEDAYYKYPHEFSGGQRQRIVIARALALNPRFLICDEAVSALDVSVQAKVLNLLNDLKREFGFTYIFISHDLNVVKYMSDRIMVMKDGKIVEIGPADEIYNSPKQEYTKQLIEAIPV